MYNPPKTKAEAERILYGSMYSRKKYDPEMCAYAVMGKRDYWAWQCSRNSGHGPDHLYCNQHAKKVESKNAPA